MNYYGAYVSEPSHRHVLCHRITVQEYERTLPNGKTIKVRGYSRQGDAASDDRARRVNLARQHYQGRVDAARSNYNSWKKDPNAYQTEATRSYYSKDGKRITEKYYRPMQEREAAAPLGRALSDQTSAMNRELAYNPTIADRARYAVEDAREFLNMGVSNFMEEVRYGAAYAGAAASEAAKKIAARAKKAYDAGKSFIEKLFGRVKEIAGNVGKAVSGAYNSARQTVTGTYNNVRNRVNQEVTNYQLRRNKRQI